MRSQFQVGSLPVLILTAAAALTAAGCGSSGPEMARVSGTVTHNGKLVPKGTVSFVATQAGGRNATGELDANGSYRLQTEETNDGVLLGDYKVAIYSHAEEILDYTPKVPIKVERLIPEKYENPDTSDLKRTVKSGSNTFDFELTD